MARKVLTGPAEPVYLTNADEITVNTGDITLGDVGITGIADGVDVTQGAVADAAVTTNAAGTISAKLRGLITLFVDFLSRLPAALTASGNLKVSIEEGDVTVGAVDVSSSALPAGASTSALQGGGLPAALTGSGNLKVSVEEGGAGGGAVTVADGADVAEGTTTDAAASSSVAEDTTARTGIGLWKGIKNILILINAKFGSLGQKNMAGSAPVVLASDQSALAVDATGQGDVPVTLDGEEVVLGAGTAAIGKLAANSGVDIGDVDITSIAAGDNNIGNVDIASAIPAGTNNIGDVDVLSLPATPAGTNLIGKISSSDETSTVYNGVTALTPKFAVISGATSGNNTVVTAVAGKKIRVLSLFLVAITAVNVRFESAADGTALTGVMSLGATGGFALPYNPVGHFETVAAELLNMELSAAVQVSGALTYVEV